MIYSWKYMVPYYGGQLNMDDSKNRVISWKSLQVCSISKKKKK
jgi:hypothetical protein